MADVQTENGYTRIANEILEKIATIKLSPTQYRLVFVIWRFTYGFKRKQHDMSLTFLSNATGCDKRQIQRELKGLEERKLIEQIIKSGSYRKISFNKNHDEWIGKTDIGETTIGEIDNGETVNTAIGENVNTTIGETTNQERKLKETIKEKKIPRKNSFDETHYKLAEFMFEEIKKNNPSHKKPNLNNWADDMRKLMELDKKTEEQIRYLVTWTQNDNFEMANVLSPSKLRKRFDQLVLKVKAQKGQSKKPNWQQMTQKSDADIFAKPFKGDVSVEEMEF